MRHPWLFGFVTLFLGWTLQSLFYYWVSPAVPSPHWLLLAVLALAGIGRVNMAQTLGFFWGLCLDVFGLGLFGSQALLLAFLGFVTARLSRQVNAEKWVTQEVLAFVGTAFFWIGFYALDSIFRTPSSPHLPPAWKVLLGFGMNALAAPVVFWLMYAWVDIWNLLTGGRHVAHD